MPMKWLMPFLITVFLPYVLHSGALQHEPLRYQDYVYTDHIASVRLHVAGLLLSYPIIRFDSEGSLLLSFDDLHGDSKFYYYTIIHCNRDWTPSQLDFNEYVDGFQSEDIRTFDRSMSTLVPFTHYSLQIPNENYRITKSGNYLLVVYLDNPDHPVITRRFMVADPKIVVHPQVRRPSDVSKLRTHQEIEFEVSAEYLRITNAREDLSAVVLQNGRWDNAVTDLHPRFERGTNYVFDYRDRMVFGAGLDFRNLDIRSTRFRSRNVHEIRRENNRTLIIAETDEPRTFRRYLTDIDINGKFIIRSLDDRRFATVGRPDEAFVEELESEGSVVEVTRHNLVADYIDVLFSLRVDAPYDSDVYVFGQLSDWRLHPAFRMTYDRQYGAYFLNVPLKQGFYNYIYVLANVDGTADETTIEGHWHEASNDYTILVYHRPFGSRYDELVAAVTVPSSR